MYLVDIVKSQIHTNYLPSSNVSSTEIANRSTDSAYLNSVQLVVDIYTNGQKYIIRTAHSECVL